MAITRLHNITGPDRIGIPVAIAARPNSRSAPAWQGQDLDLAATMASASMEAFDVFHTNRAHLRHSRHRPDLSSVSKRDARRRT
jgi:ribosomal protein S12 methylthiotransferase accessory factor YcaO